MKRKSAQLNPEVPLEALIDETVATVATGEVEPSLTTVEATEVSVQAEEEATKPSAMQMVEQSPAETVESQATEVIDSPSSTEFLPSIEKYLGNAVYGAFYCVSYGVVFSALTVARMVPTNNLIGRAIKEGALAARSAQEKISEEPAISAETTRDDSIVLNV